MSLEEHGKEKYLVCRIINRTHSVEKGWMGIENSTHSITARKFCVKSSVTDQ